MLLGFRTAMRFRFRSAVKDRPSATEAAREQVAATYRAEKMTLHSRMRAMRELESAGLIATDGKITVVTPRGMAAIEAGDIPEFKERNDT